MNQVLPGLVRLLNCGLQRLVEQEYKRARTNQKIAGTRSAEQNPETVQQAGHVEPSVSQDRRHWRMLATKRPPHPLA